ncbi:MAG: Na+/H+-dicarboxylate symporter [Bacteroidia bacterium]|jgi:Na+/H+-dicarboxylate symporter
MSIDRFKQEYPALSTICTLLKVIGIVILAISIMGMIYGVTLLDSDEVEQSIGYTLISYSIVGGLILTILFFAFAELIKLFVRIEFNTRRTTDDEIKKQTDDEQDNSIPSNFKKHGLSFDDWKKENPDQTINDYYASLR